MNGGESLSSRGVPLHRPKANLLSSYLVSDEEDESVDSSVGEAFSTLLDDEGRHGSSQGGHIQVLTSSTVTSLLPLYNSTSSSTLNSSSCDLNSTMDSNSSRSPLPPPVNLWSDDTIDSTTPRRSQYRVTFEIIRAKTVSDNTEKGPNGGGRNRGGRHVSYTLLIKRVPGLETKPAVIERRYSDFLSFYTAIKKRYPLLLKEIPFPKKILIGNFSADVIAERSLAFQAFLSYSLSIPEIRCSPEFATFLYYAELREAQRCLSTIHLEEAANILENVVFIQEKLAIHSGRPSPQLVHTLCALTGCLNALDNTSEAKKIANQTFDLLFANSMVINENVSANGGGGKGVYEVSNLYECSPLVLPLILLSLRLRWFTGPQKLALERKLEELCRTRTLPRNGDSQPSLLSLILDKDFSLILE